jgi:gluconate 2-dehydrogenase alpha chain
MLLSGIGRPYDPATGTGAIGRNYCYQIISSVNVFYDDKLINPFIGAGSLGMIVDDYNGDNFDHRGKGFIGGGYIGVVNTGARPIESHPTPDKTPKWGAEWKKAVAHNYRRTLGIHIHGSCMSYRQHYLDLDPTYKDANGLPLLRMTFDFGENEHRMSDFLTDRAAEIGKAMGGREIKVNKRKGAYDIVPYQTTHNTGGAVMGSDPRTSALNLYLQSWDVPNLFVPGANAFPQNAGYNPMGTVGALTYWCAEAIASRYVRSPSPLVQA